MQNEQIPEHQFTKLAALVVKIAGHNTQGCDSMALQAVLADK
jgi:hypothetical protein